MYSSKSTLRIAHISDIHAHAETSALDSGLAVAGVDSLKSLERSLIALFELQQLDFLVVSGDIAHYNKLDEGHSAFKDTITRIMSKTKLSPVEIVIVPGNHDVAIVNNTVSRASFRKYFEEFTIPSDMANISSLHEFLEDAAPGDLFPISKLGVKLPFAYSQDCNAIIYAFDSTALFGELHPDAKNLDAIIAKLESDSSYSHTDELIALVKFRNMPYKSPALHHTQRDLFKLIMHKFSSYNKLNDPPLIIAVLHHHIGNIDTDTMSIKAFSDLLDAGPFKKDLADLGVQLVLHGHKHLSYIGFESSTVKAFNEIRLEKPPLVISGPAVSKYRPREGQYSSYNVLELSRVMHGDDVPLVNVSIKQIRLDNAPHRIAFDHAEQLDIEVGHTLAKDMGDSISAADVTIYPGRSRPIKNEYETRIRHAYSAIDIMGLSLATFLYDYRDSLFEISKQVPIRILLIDPSFPEVSKSNSIAALRAKEEKREAGEIVSGVISWINFVKDNLSSYMKEDCRLKISLYSVIPTVNIFRVDGSLFAGPYLLGLDSRDTVTLLAQDKLHTHQYQIIFNDYMYHFNETWNHSSTRDILSVREGEMKNWAAEYQLPLDDQ